jgi:NADH-quinone oxidoreductase subunit E
MTWTFAEIFSKFKGKESELIPLLQAVQAEHGYLSREAMLEIAKFTNVAESQVYSVATFYSQFRFTPIGKNHIMACRGTACHVKGAPKIREKIETHLKIKEGETSKDGKFSLETVACIGACGLAPAMVINKKTYGRLTPKKVIEILDKLGGKNNE